MALLIADCPRCNVNRMTFDLIVGIIIGIQYEWQDWYEAFCKCRNCKKSTVFVLSIKDPDDRKVFFSAGGISSVNQSINEHVNIKGFINLKDFASVKPPEHVPEEIEKVFIEGATCLSVGCYNAAGTMFRLCVDLATKAMLPETNDNGLTDFIRRTLGLRIPWLIEHDLLPKELKRLSSCIKEDGNDGAHSGSLNKLDTDDLLDFTIALLERIYTEPERLRLAEERTKKRRNAS